MSQNDLGENKMVLVVGIAIFVVAFAMLMFIGDYRFIAAFFLALLLALLAAIVYYLAFLPGMRRETGEAERARARLGSGASAGTSPGGTATADDAGAKAAADDAARKAAEEKAAADAAQKAADEKAAADAAAKKAADAADRKATEDKAAADAAARKAAEEKSAAEAASRKAAADEAARKAAADEAARKAAADEAARKAAEERAAAERAAATEPATPAASGTQYPGAETTDDYDGDGVREGIHEGTRPTGLDGPRGGSADDLKLIKGVGPKLEALLNRLGFWHFDQVAGWSANEVAWVDANLEGFKGRVSRDEWVEQARVLASGGTTEFSKRVEDGDVY